MISREDALDELRRHIWCEIGNPEIVAKTACDYIESGIVSMADVNEIIIDAVRQKLGL